MRRLTNDEACLLGRVAALRHYLKAVQDGLKDPPPFATLRFDQFEAAVKALEAIYSVQVWEFKP